MGHADALSRLPLPGTDPDPAPAGHVMSLEDLQDPPLQAGDIAKRSSRDPVLARVLDWVGRGSWPQEPVGENFKPFKARRDELSAHKGCLLWGSRVVVPKPLQRRVLEALHVAHPGIVRMKALARSYVWWPGMDDEIEAWVKRCHICQESRPDPPQSPIQSGEGSRTPWSRLHMDFAGPFQGQILLIIVDAYSKWLEVCRVPSTSSQAVIKALRPIFATHGIPDAIWTDNATAFTGQEFQDFLGANAIRHIRSAPFHPASNGMAERAVRTAKESLKRIMQGDWERRLAEFLLYYRTTPHTTSGRSPAELLMGRRLTTCLDRLHPDRTSGRERNPEVKATPRTFAVGDPVWVKNYARGPAWLPGWVRRATGPVSYEVSIEGGPTVRKHVDQLRHRLPPAEGDDWEPATVPAEPRDEPGEPAQEAPRPEELREPAEAEPPANPRSPEPATPVRASTPARPATPGRPKATPAAEQAGSPGPPPPGAGAPEPRRSQRIRRPPDYLKDFVH